MGQNTRSYEYSVQISAFQSFRIQNGDLKTIFHCSSSTIHQGAETAVRRILRLLIFQTWHLVCCLIEVKPQSILISKTKKKMFFKCNSYMVVNILVYDYCPVLAQLRPSYEVKCLPAYLFLLLFHSFLGLRVILNEFSLDVQDLVMIFPPPFLAQLKRTFFF